MENKNKDEHTENKITWKLASMRALSFMPTPFVKKGDYCVLEMMIVLTANILSPIKTQ